LGAADGDGGGGGQEGARFGGVRASGLCCALPDPPGRGFDRCRRRHRRDFTRRL
jgi:hypothetical protein